MNTQIHARFSELPPRFRFLAKVRIQRTLQRWHHRLTKVRVFLKHEGGPRGGSDKSCRFVLETRRGGPIVTKGRGCDADGALSQALQRARKRIRRREQRLTAKVRTRPDRRNLETAA